jgi:hypothetical protein
MRTFLSRSVLGAILAGLTIGAATAQAATGPVTVRVEGASATLIPPTLVATRSGSFSPMSDPSHSCSASSAAYALELATIVNGTSWSGPFFDPSGFFVTTIGPESYPLSGSSYWNFWYDHAPATVGICGQQLNPNDEILFFPDCFGATCAAGTSSPNVLGMTAPTVAQKGASIAVAVTSYASADGTPSPAVGATVSGGGAAATTSGTGAAQLTFPTIGTFTIRATATHAIRSEPHTVCVHDGNDGNCGTTAPPGTTPTPNPTGATTQTQTPATTGPAATTTTGPPHGHLAIREGTVFAHGHGPNLIVGTIDPDSTGLRTVALRLTRQVAHGHCEAFNAKRRKFTAASCGLQHAPAFSIGHAYAFSYLLPSKLGPGRYTLQVSAVDVAGKQDGPAPGRNRIVFRVR